MTKYTSRILGSVVTLLLTIACSSDSLPPNYTYTRHPARYETLTTPLDTLTIDNCANDAALEQTFARAVQVGETVSLDRAEVQRIGLAAGISNMASIMANLEMEISQQFGAGLQSGQSQERAVAVYVNPERKATVFLTWIETWEHGNFATYKDGEPLGTITYSLLKEVELDSRVESFRCGWIGDAEARVTALWEQFTTQPQVAELWNNRRLEVLGGTAGVLLLLILLVTWRLRAAGRARRADDFDFG